MATQKIVHVLSDQLKKKHHLDKPHIESLSFAELNSIHEALAEYHGKTTKKTKMSGLESCCSCSCP